MGGQPAAGPLRFYVFYFEDALEGEHVYATVKAAKLPHRLQKFYSSAYAGATSLGRGWGRVYVPEGAIDDFMTLTGNRLAPEPEMYVEQVSTRTEGASLLARLRDTWRAFVRWLDGH